MTYLLVSATRCSSKQFYSSSLLGQSLAQFIERRYPLKPCIAFDNRRGLPAIYNAAIDAAAPDDTLVFMHDDAMMLDYFWPERLMAGFARFEVLGLAGNIRRVPRQPAWWSATDGKELDDGYLSGIVAHGTALPFVLGSYGPPMQRCRLMDGVFLAVQKATLARSGLRFDERFDFHYYDMDFCREAEQRGVTMGTIALAILHQATGLPGTESWHANGYRYFEKWRN